MGCFNYRANLSNLPIEAGDRIVVILGFYRRLQFIPLSFPIRGEYDDYGNIENKEMTGAVKILEESLGLSVEDFMREVVREDNDYRNSLLEKIEQFASKQRVLSYFMKEEETNWKEEISFAFFMEHEDIFDNLVNLSNCSLLDKHFWRIPYQYILQLGFTPDIIKRENDHCYQEIDWSKDGCESFYTNCYNYASKEKMDSGCNLGHTLKELIKYTKSNYPAYFNRSYLELIFENDLEIQSKSPTIDDETEVIVKNKLKFLSNEAIDKIFEEAFEKVIEDENVPKSDELDKVKDDIKYLSEIDLDGETFTTDSCVVLGRYGSKYGLFNPSESCGTFWDFLPYRRLNLKPEWKKELVDMRAFLMTKSRLNLDWGTSQYHSQSIDYRSLKSFVDSISAKLDKKILEYVDCE